MEGISTISKNGKKMYTFEFTNYGKSKEDTVSLITAIGDEFALAISTIVPYMIFILFVGIAIANASIYWESLLQSGIPSEFAGRVFSISSMIGNTSLPLAFGIFGLLLNNSSIEQVMIFSGICLVGLSCLLMYGYRKKRTKIESTVIWNEEGDSKA